jgi:sigma-E factor negative regulatory protein RseA
VVKQEMKADLSAFMDGELEAGSRNGPLETLTRDPALRRTWDEYQLIGDALRGVPNVGVRLADRVMARLADEPTVLAPAAIARPGRRGPLRHALALAASVVGVAVVAWLALSVNSPQLAQVAQVTTLSPPAVPAPELQRHLRVSEWRTDRDLAHHTRGRRRRPARKAGGARRQPPGSDTDERRGALLPA